MPTPKEKRNSVMESRRVPRVPVEGTVHFVVAPKMRREVGLLHPKMIGEIIDIGTLGIGIRSPVFLPRGTRIQGRFFSMPFGGEEKKGGIRFVGFVMNVMNIRRPGEAGYRMGVQFERLAERNFSAIDAFVKKCLGN